tara:strand:+ start:664 stop:891 length:228 start_codon:yes stop_codon:yes gene_type:complete
MAKGNRATRKELEKIIGEMIRQLSHLDTAVKAIDGYVGEYVAWKGDTLEYNQHLEKKYRKTDDEKNQEKAPQPPL